MRNITKPSSLQLFIGAIVLAFFSFRNSKKLSPPKKVGKFTLSKNFFRKDNSFNSAIGIYTYKTKKVLVKYWQGRYKDLTYYLLKQEYSVNKFLYEKSKRIKLRSTIKFVEPLEIIEGDQYLALCYEYIDGQKLIQKSKNIQIKTITSIIDYLTEFSKHLTKKEQSNFFKRGINQYMMVLCISIFIVYFKITKYKNDVMQSFKTCFNEYKYIKNTKLILAHRDLTPENIILKGKYIYLLDCENMAFTIPHYDKVNFFIIFLSTNKNKAKKTDKKEDHSEVFLKNYITLYNTIGSGNFLQVNEIFLNKIHEINA